MRRGARWLPLVLAAVAALGATMPSVAFARPAGAEADTGVVCPHGATCTTIAAYIPPAPYHHKPNTKTCVELGQPCPMVVASAIPPPAAPTPPTGLGNDEAVYLSLDDFPTVYQYLPGGPVAAEAYVSICSLNQMSECLDENTYPDGYIGAEEVGLLNGDGSASFVVEQDPPGNGDTGLGASGFFCGVGGVDPCAIDVSIVNSSEPPAETADRTAANTAQIPFSFAPAEAAGCTPASPSVPTESAFTLERLIPALNVVSCRGSGMYDFDTSVSSNQIASAVTGGSSPIGYTDEPQTDDVQEAILSGHYKLIPVAATATVDAFAVAETHPPETVGVVSSWEMTPTDVAASLTGLTNLYDQIEVSTSVQPSLLDGPYVTSSQDPTLCPKQVNDPNEEEWCPLPMVLNAPPTGFDLQNGKVASAYLGPPSGTTEELIDWLCASPGYPPRPGTTSSAPPVVPLPDGTSYPLSYNAAYALEQPAANNDPPSPWPLASVCSAPPDNLPALTLGNTAVIDDATSPADQAHFLYKNDAPLTQSAGSPPYAGFAPMDWSQAAYYGFGVASLQNQAGAFVAPTAASIDAAIANDSSTLPDGVLAFNFDPAHPDIAAYPMPMVSYALVPTTPQTTGQAAAMKTLLLDLLSITSVNGANVGELPAGYVPLPANLSATAIADVKADIVARSPSTPAPERKSSGTSTKTATTSATPTTTSQGVPVPTISVTGRGQLATAPSAPSGPALRPPIGVSDATKVRGPLAALSSYRMGRVAGGWVIPVGVSVTATGLVVGPAMLLIERRRRRRALRVARD